MNNRNNKNTKKSMVPGLIVLAAVLAFNLVEEGVDGNPLLIVVVLGCVIVLLVIAATVAAAKKATARGASAERPVRAEAPSARRTPAFTRAAEQEEAIHCSHVRGKQKYIEQLDSYLKNGIIDKAEYRVLRERYEKLELPDDYH